MKVSAQFAEEHFADILDAASNGEDVEIALAAGKPTLRLILSTPAHNAVPVNRGVLSDWKTPERPRSEFFNSMKGKIHLSEDWDSPETNKEIEEMFEASEIFPESLGR